MQYLIQTKDVRGKGRENILEMTVDLSLEMWVNKKEGEEGPVCTESRRNEEAWEAAGTEHR